MRERKKEGGTNEQQEGEEENMVRGYKPNDRLNLGVRVTQDYGLLESCQGKQHPCSNLAVFVC